MRRWWFQTRKQSQSRAWSLSSYPRKTQPSCLDRIKKNQPQTYPFLTPTHHKSSSPPPTPANQPVQRRSIRRRGFRSLPFFHKKRQTPLTSLWASSSDHPPRSESGHGRKQRWLTMVLMRMSAQSGRSMAGAVIKVFSPPESPSRLLAVRKGTSSR